MTTPIAPISLFDVRAEFGGPTSPIPLNSYYAGGAYVSNPGPTSVHQIGGIIPTGGTIGLGSFRGVSDSFYSTEFSDLSGWTVNPTGQQPGPQSGFRYIGIQSIPAPPQGGSPARTGGQAVRFTADGANMSAMWRTAVPFNTTSSFSLDYDMVINDDTSEHFLIFGAVSDSAAGTGLRFSNAGAQLQVHEAIWTAQANALDFTPTTLTLVYTKPSPTTLDRWLRVIVNGTKSGGNSYNITISIFDYTTGVTTTSGTINIGTYTIGTRFVIGYSGNQDGAGESVYIDSLTLDIA